MPLEIIVGVHVNQVGGGLAVLVIRIGAFSFSNSERISVALRFSVVTSSVRIKVILGQKSIHDS